MKKTGILLCVTVIALAAFLLIRNNFMNNGTEALNATDLSRSEDIVEDEPVVEERTVLDSQAESAAAEKPSVKSVEEIIADNTSGFVALKEVIPNLQEEIRYYSDYNFVGDPITGYEEPVAILSLEAALALREAALEAESYGLGFRIYDAYRPQSAVNHFLSWAQNYEDQRMKEFFYPNLDKSTLFTDGYLAAYSGHSRASTVDLTLYDLESGEILDMGTPFDFLDPASHPFEMVVSQEQYDNRMLLQQIMMNHGFQGITTEWWHFTLLDEPYPYDYFDFPVNEGYVG